MMYLYLAMTKYVAVFSTRKQIRPQEGKAKGGGGSCFLRCAETPGLSEMESVSAKGLRKRGVSQKQRLPSPERKRALERGNKSARRSKHCRKLFKMQIPPPKKKNYMFEEMLVGEIRDIRDTFLNMKCESQKERKRKKERERERKRENGTDCELAASTRRAPRSSVRAN